MADENYWGLLTLLVNDKLLTTYGQSTQISKTKSYSKAICLLIRHLRNILALHDEDAYFIGRYQLVSNVDML